MTDIFNLLVGLFSDIINFLNNFYIIGNLSILKLIFIIAIFSIAIKFLFNHKGE